MNIPGVEVIKVISPNHIFMAGAILGIIAVIALATGWIASLRYHDSSITGTSAVVFFVAIIATACLLVCGMATPWTEYKVSIDETAPFLEIYQNFNIRTTSKGLFILSPKDSMVILE